MTPNPDPAVLGRAVRRAARLAHFRAKYAGLLPVSTDEGFRALPFSDQSDLAACADELRRNVVGGPRGAYVFSSGGTTGNPKLSFVDQAFFLDRILDVWRPLEAGDVLLNLFAPGRLWSAHYFYNELATRSGATALAVGDLAPPEHEPWWRLAGTLGTTSIAATPTGLERLLGSWAGHGHTLPTVRTVLWVGEPLLAGTVALVRRVLPNAGLWGLYGSTETWAVAENRPGCDPDVVHPFAHQHVELDGDGGVAVTTLDDRQHNPIVRYRLGDRGSWADCACATGKGLRLRGRADEAVKFRGTLLQPGLLVDLAMSTPGVRQAQVAVVTTADGGERLEVRCVLDPVGPPDVGALRDLLLGQSMELNNLFDDDPEGFRVHAVGELAATVRSVKTPPLVCEVEA